jgi:hypothetical protein
LSEKFFITIQTPEFLDGGGEMATPKGGTVDTQEPLPVLRLRDISKYKSLNQ